MCLIFFPRQTLWDSPILVGNLGFLYLDDLRCFDHQILPGDGFSPCGLVVVGALMAFRVPVLRAEELATPALKSDEPHPPSAPVAAVHDELGLRWCCFTRSIRVACSRCCSSLSEGQGARWRGRSEGSNVFLGESMCLFGYTSKWHRRPFIGMKMKMHSN